MKAMLKYLALGLSVLIMAALFAGCAKPPTTEMEAAKGKIDAAIAVGAEKYAKDGLKSLNDTWQAAQDEVKKQEGKLFKNYDAAKQLIAKADADAVALKADTEAKKEAAKAEAEAASAAAATAVTEAEGLLAQAPMGKGTKADIEAMKADLESIKGSLAEITSMIAAEDFFAATDKAKAVSAKAAEISASVQAAIEKSGKRRK
jgi:hypothetical protein